MNIYVGFMYAFFWGSTLLGAFNHTFDANLWQRIGLCLLGCGALWGMELQLKSGLTNPHDIMTATGLAAYALGTIFKTNSYRLGGSKCY